jgi:hypothetical protein
MKTLSKMLLLAPLLMVEAQVVAGRTERQATAIVRGSVVGGVDLGAIDSCVVTARPANVSTVDLRTETDTSGRFQIRVPTSTNLILTATCPGFIPSDFGASRPGQMGVPIAPSTLRLADFDAKIRVFRGGVIAGTLRDVTGAAARRVSIRAISRGLRPDEVGPSILSVTTDESGRFRLYGLLPGSYKLQAVPPSRVVESLGRRKFAAPTFYPGVTDESDGQQIAVGPEQELAGVDFAIQAVETYRLSGTVSGVHGEGERQVIRVFAGGREVVTEPAGQFALDNVPQGMHTIVARAVVDRQGSQRIYWARQELAVVSDLDNTTLVLGPGVTLVGLVVDARDQPVQPPSAVRLERIDRPDCCLRFFDQVVQPDGRFEFRDLQPGRYILRSGSQRVPIVTVTSGRLDVFDLPLDLSPGRTVDVKLKLAETAMVVGQLPSASVGYAFVLLSPRNPELLYPGSSRIRLARADTTGAFAIANVIPGDYQVRVFEDVDHSVLLHAGFIEGLATPSQDARDVRVGIGGRTVVDWGRR